MKIIVAAGGQGTKIWPFSRKQYPKQFQKIISEDSLFTININMLLTQYKPEDIFISTKKMYLPLVSEQAPNIPKNNIILEPDIPNGRGPAEGLAFLILSIRHPDEPFTILQSDCLYIPNKKYLKTLKILEDTVIRDKKFISGGQKPLFPVLGVDYLSLGEQIPTKKGADLYKVEEFLGRKDNYEETEKIISNQNAVIHTNINTWYPNLMLEAYKKYKPDWYSDLMRIKEVIGLIDEEKKIEAIYSNMKEGRTEEVTKRVFNEGYIVVLNFKWIDIGTWESAYQYLSSHNENYIDGNVVALESTGTLVKSTNTKKLIALLGLQNMVVVDTEDILFIAPREKLDILKDLHQELKNKGLENYL